MNRSDTRRSAAVVVLVWACIVVALASLPYIAGVASHRPGQSFVGFTYNIDDACVYSSWIRQIADGSFFIRNQYTTEPQPALPFNLFFLLLGFVARVTHLSPAAVFHIARIVLGVGLLGLIWKFSSRFLEKPAERLLVVPIVGMASGLGWLLSGIGGHQGPVDLWQPEAITFLSIYLNPLFLIGMILMVAALHFFLRARETGSLRDAALAGLMLLLLGNIHTYDVLTVGVVWAVYLVVDAIVSRKIPWRIFGLSAMAAAMALPSVGYQYYLYSHVEAVHARVQSPTPAPALWAYLMGYGLLLIFAVAGAWAAMKEKRDALLLVVWSIVGFALPYAPVPQQRKLVMGLHIPLAILAVIAVAALVKRAGARNGGIVAILVVAAMVPSNLLFISRDIGMLADNTTAPGFRPYLPDTELQAMNWLRDHSKPEDVVLAFPDTALFVPAVAGNRVYYGHWSETPDYGEKLNEWVTFVNSSTPDTWRREFLRRTGARYIIYFSHPDGLTMPLGPGDSVPVVGLRTLNYLEVVFESGDTAVYRVKN